ncbi:ArsR/SmtB family transcription factor [Halovivax gelatinilyticus]|uniref:ArsR/SmtB family transcription factor n=1 Tax=Halovivax gelatinilyticus TaxID=2961597 RepID=UPI0020CA3123|nr:winged helix-turn-helix domain-containing protein [Halovivax gelatinilyticus]
MSPDRPRRLEDRPADPADQLPPNSVLDLDEYIEMYAAIGDRTRYEILYRLVHTGDMNVSDLAETLSTDPNTLGDQLDRLLDAGLIQRRKQTDKGDTAVRTYFRATILGEVALTEGIDELIQGEQEFPAMYGSSVEE